jgi:hypothetical protein
VIGDACGCGDFDGDGLVSTTDVRLIRRLAVGQVTKDDLGCAERP